MPEAFREIKNTLDNMKKEHTHDGVGVRKEHDYISPEHEQILWEKGVLGETNPDQLR